MGSIVLSWPLLFGQVAEAGGVVNSGGVPPVVILIPIVVLTAVALLIGVPVVLGIRSEQRRREMEHAERMRAIELGRPIPDEPGWWSPARTAVGVGVGVPIGVFGIAWIAAASPEAAAPFIWPSAGAVGMAAVICGTVLAARLPATQPSSTVLDPRAKPYVDPDAFDLAEHRHS